MGSAVKQQLHVAGVGQTRVVPEDARSIPEMVLEAVDAALADAGVRHEQVGAVTTASVDLFDGTTASSLAITEVVGAVLKAETRIAGDGVAALAHAACQLWAGAYDTVLVVAHGKASMAPHFELTSWAMDPVHLQPLGVDFRVCAGLAAQAMLAQDPGARERWARTAATRRAASGDTSLDALAILDSGVLASPITSGMSAPLADCACAIVLRASDDDAPGVRLTGVGYDLDAHHLGDRDLTRWPGLGRAYRRACEVAGVDAARVRWGVLEPSCLYAHEERLFVDAIGSEAVGDGRGLSPEGGLFGGAAPIAAGLGRVIAATRQLRAAPELSTALAHGAWGPAGQAHAVALLEVVS